MSPTPASQKVAIVTGASGGIGAGTVDAFRTRECAGDSSDVEDNPLQRSPKTESVVALSCQYGR